MITISPSTKAIAKKRAWKLLRRSEILWHENFVSSNVNWYFIRLDNTYDRVLRQALKITNTFIRRLFPVNNSILDDTYCARTYIYTLLIYSIQSSLLTVQPIWNPTNNLYWCYSVQLLLTTFAHLQSTQIIIFFNSVAACSYRIVEANGKLIPVQTD